MLSIYSDLKSIKMITKKLKCNLDLYYIYISLMLIKVLEAIFYLSKFRSMKLENMEFNNFKNLLK